MKKLFYGNPICNIFGHKWIYSININNHYPQQELRACKRCGAIEEYRRNFLGYESNWFKLVMRTKLGGINLIKELECEPLIEMSRKKGHIK